MYRIKYFKGDDKEMNKEVKTALKSIKNSEAYKTIYDYIKYLEKYNKLLIKIGKQDIKEETRELKHDCAVLRESSSYYFWCYRENERRIDEAIRYLNSNTYHHKYDGDCFSQYDGKTRLIKILEGKVKEK